MVKEKLDILLSIWQVHTEDCGKCREWDERPMAPEILKGTYGGAVGFGPVRIAPCDYGKILIGRMALMLKSFIDD